MLRGYDVAYFMASTDTLEDVTAFARKNEANFPILSDLDRSASAAFGVLTATGHARRWTFYVDAGGRILHIDRSISPSTAGPDLAENLRKLGYPRRAENGDE